MAAVIILKIFNKGTLRVAAEPRRGSAIGSHRVIVQLKRRPEQIAQVVLHAHPCWHLTAPAARVGTTKSTIGGLHSPARRWRVPTGDVAPGDGR